MNRILVVNINWLGDAVFSTPVFRALKQAHPDAYVACLCVPRLVDVLRHCPDIDEFIIYDEKGKHRFPWDKLALIRRLRAKKFDVAFLLHRSMTRALLVLLAGIPKRIGFGKAKIFLTTHVDSGGEDIHRLDHYLKVVEAAGIECTARQYRLHVDPEEQARLDEKLKNQGLMPGKDFIVFNTGGNWALKRWPMYVWIDVARRVGQNTGLKIVFSGSEKDGKDAERIMQESRVHGINLAGQTTIGESLALFAKAKVVLSADSGPVHMAAAVGTPVVGIFGPTRPEITGPRGIGEAVVLFKEVGCNKAPCYHLACTSNVCMRIFEAEHVWQALQKFIR